MFKILVVLAKLGLAAWGFIATMVTVSPWLFLLLQMSPESVMSLIAGANLWVVGFAVLTTLTIVSLGFVLIMEQ